MNSDFIPQTDALLWQWCDNYDKVIGEIGPAVGLSADEITAQQTSCRNIKTSISDVGAQKTIFAASVKGKQQTLTIEIPNLRAEIGSLKTNKLVTLDIQTQLNIAPNHKDFDGDNYKATITAELIAGIVRLKFKKLGADGINIYHRKKGDIQWLFLVRATKSPFDDHITLATPSQPEHWEYRAFGVEDDLEIGQPSDIIEIVFGG